MGQITFCSLQLTVQGSSYLCHNILRSNMLRYTLNQSLTWEAILKTILSRWCPAVWDYNYSSRNSPHHLWEQPFLKRLLTAFKIFPSIGNVSYTLAFRGKVCRTVGQAKFGLCIQWSWHYILLFWQYLNYNSYSDNILTINNKNI